MPMLQVNQFWALLTLTLCSSDRHHLKWLRPPRKPCLLDASLKQVNHFSFRLDCGKTSNYQIPFQESELGFHRDSTLQLRMSTTFEYWLQSWTQSIWESEGVGMTGLQCPILKTPQSSGILPQYGKRHVCLFYSEFVICLHLWPGVRVNY